MGLKKGGYMIQIIWTVVAAGLFRAAECIVKLQKEGKLGLLNLIKEYLSLG